MTTVYRIHVDRSLCSGFGSCVDEAPGAFSLENGVAIAVATSRDASVLAAADACPMGAITVTCEELEDAA